MLEEALSLARGGFAIHWLYPKSKSPIGKDWSTVPVMSPERLKDSYRAGNNVGVRLGEWSKIDGLFLHVIDTDIRDATLADACKSKLFELFPDAESYPTVKSGSGGHSRHSYILTSEPFSSKKLAHSAEKIQTPDGKWHWAWEIELFGTGKQVVIPPSIHPDTELEYRWLTPFDFDDIGLGLGPVVPARYIADLIGARDDADKLPDDERTAPLGLSLEEIRDVLSELPVEYWRDDRDGWLSVGFALHHETEGSDQGYKLWLDFSRDSDKFDAKDQKRVWKSFGKAGSRSPLRMATLVSAAREARLQEDIEASLDELDDLENIGESTKPASPLDDFDDVLGGDSLSETKRAKKLKKAEVEADLGHIPIKIKRMNKKHALAFVKGKTIVITEKPDGTVDYGSLHDLHAWYENDRVPNEKTTEPLSKAWLRHKKRREYPNGIVFAPGLKKDGYYNHWRGWTVEADPEGSCRLWLEHLHQVICSGNDIHYEYALGWFAHLVQKPWEKPGVAMVLRGRKRIGKDTIMDYAGGLFADHRVKIASQDQMVGKFNAHQERALVLHVEEGFWAGNKQAEGVLKYLITSENVLIERKGIDGFSVDSYLRLFMSSNEDWVVPATADEGRYFVLDVSAHRKDDHAYFRRLREEMKNGGRAALLHYLLNYDISDFEVRNVPSTEALGQQKIQGLRNIERFWFDILDSAEMPVDHGTRHGRGGSWTGDSIVVDRAEFHAKYEQWVNRRRYDKATESVAIVSKKLNEMLCNTLDTFNSREGNRRVRKHIFPPIGECRKHFERYLGSEVVWDEPIDVEELDDVPEISDDYDDLNDI